MGEYDDRSKYPYRDAVTPAGRKPRLKKKYLAARNDPSTIARGTKGK